MATEMHRVGLDEIVQDLRLGPLDLQMTDLEIDTPDDLYQSGNSIYACCAHSGLSMCC